MAEDIMHIAPLISTASIARYAMVADICTSRAAPHAGLKHLRLGSKNARYIVHRPFNQGRPVRVGSRSLVTREASMVCHRVHSARLTSVLRVRNPVALRS